VSLSIELSLYVNRIDIIAIEREPRKVQEIPAFIQEYGKVSRETFSHDT